MLKAYHIIGIDHADLFRLRAGRITEEAIVQKAEQLHDRIIRDGELTASAHHQQDSQDYQDNQHQSRQFDLDRLVGDDQYVYLSLGKRYWNLPASVNFGFVFDAADLVRKHKAILRKHDLLQEYEDLLEDVVQQLTPVTRPSLKLREQLLSFEDDIAASNASPSPNDAYYALLEAVKQQHLHVPQASEATNEFIKRARALQRRYQLSGKEAIQAMEQEGETGHFELLVKDRVPLKSVSLTIIRGKEKSI